MFGSKKPEISIFDYYISLNEERINDWIGSDKEIGCRDEWRPNDPGVVDHIINYLPKSGVHFHRTPGVFSESVAGGYETSDGEAIEWGIRDDHFVVMLEMKEKTLFCCPLARAAQMLSKGNNETRNFSGESNLIDIDLGDNLTQVTCRKVLETTWSTYSLRYSNNLVRVVFELPPKHNVLYYDSYLDPK